MDSMKAQIADLETWRESAQRQLNKLFAGQVELQKIVEKHSLASETSRKEMHDKLDLILQRQEEAEKKDSDHDSKIAEARAEREELKQTVSSMVSQEMKEKGLPSSGKQLYGCVGVAGAVGSALMTVFLAVLPHLEELGDFIVKVWQGFTQ